VGIALAEGTDDVRMRTDAAVFPAAALRDRSGSTGSLLFFSNLFRRDAGPRLLLDPLRSFLIGPALFRSNNPRELQSS